MKKKHRRIKKIDDFIVRLLTLRYDAFHLGLYRTAHVLDKVQDKVGWEYADILEGKQLSPLKKERKI